MSATLPVTGDMAPAFTLPRDGGGTLSLADYRGRPVVLYFYPKDDTTACTQEALDFTAAADAFAAKGAVVIGVSKDTVRKHDRFRDKHGLTVALASDAEGTVCEDYGVWAEKSMYGKTFMGIVRSTFLIGADGRIVVIWPKVKVAGHVAEVLSALDGI